MGKYVVYAVAEGTFYTEVEAESAKDAVKAAQGMTWTLCDEPEPGEPSSVYDVYADETYSIDTKGRVRKDRRT
jgi:hypothetical protein